MENMEYWVYINYPNSQITVHKSDCLWVERAGLKANKDIRVEVANNEEEASCILVNIQFRAQARYNSVWLALDFKDEVRQKEFAKKIPVILGRRYRVFQDLKTNFCGNCFPRGCNHE
ncbi:MAG: hypothetical protein J7J73_01915 [Deltaproteobacteria bacterium]|nr:hypothetical protein [Deltaproteobacteria bacterium]